MKTTVSWKLVSVNMFIMLALSGCHSEPNTPMEAVMSDVSTTKYSIDFYEALSDSNHKEYAALVHYCHEHRNKPNCDNVQIAEANIFNRDPPQTTFLHRKA